MRDTAHLASMDDPSENRWFSRRWVDLPRRSRPLAPVVRTLDTIDAEVLVSWRAETGRA